MKLVLRVVALVLLLSLPAAAQQPMSILFGLPAPPYERYNLILAFPFAEQAQLFIEAPGIQAVDDATQYAERWGAGFRVFPFRDYLFVGAGAWTPDAIRFDANGEEYTVGGGVTWLAGLRIRAAEVATIEVQYDGFGGWAAGWGVSF